MPAASPKTPRRASTSSGPVLCLVCSEREATTKGRCDTCARYFRRHGCDRPVHLTARPCAADSVMRLLMRPGDVPIVLPVLVTVIAQRPAAS